MITLLESVPYATLSVADTWTTKAFIPLDSLSIEHVMSNPAAICKRLHCSCSLDTIVLGMEESSAYSCKY